jgi:hypothetical protein
MDQKPPDPTPESPEPETPEQQALQESQRRLVALQAAAENPNLSAQEKALAANLLRSQGAALQLRQKALQHRQGSQLPPAEQSEQPQEKPESGLSGLTPN